MPDRKELDRETLRPIIRSAGFGVEEFTISPITRTIAATCLPQAFPVSITRRFLLVLPLIVVAIGLCFSAGVSRAAAEKDGKSDQEIERIAIYDLAPDPRGGRGYKLVYSIQAPLDIYWRFKTDFDSDLLVKNQYIREHRLISHHGDVVLTADKYTNGPEVFFQWRTKVFPDDHRLDFVLLNPKECGEKFHYGSIRAEAADHGTRVTQVAYLDFWGISLWMAIPWHGGMKDFLTYMAHWEQEVVLQHKGRYSGEPPGKDDKSQ